jgi:hypothetical protein
MKQLKTNTTQILVTYNFCLLIAATSHSHDRLFEQLQCKHNEVTNQIK